MTRCHCRIEYRGRAYDSWQALADDYGLSGKRSRSSGIRSPVSRNAAEEAKAETAA